MGEHKDGGHTPGPRKLIWWGNEEYLFPLSIDTADGTKWIRRDGVASSKADAHLIASAPTLKAENERMHAVLESLHSQHDPETNTILVDPDPGCIICTAGTTPDDCNTGLCAFHEMELLIAEAREGSNG